WSTAVSMSLLLILRPTFDVLEDAGTPTGRRSLPAAGRDPWSGAQPGAQFLLRRGGQRGHDGLDCIVLERRLSILQAKAESKTFFIRLQTLAAVFIKQNNGLHEFAVRVRRQFGAECIEQ